LRREGIYSSTISYWRKARDKGALAGLAGPGCGPKAAGAAERRAAELEAENHKLKAELDTARQVVKVQGELAALLEKLSASSATPFCGSEARK
jgi:transposase-like protein